MGWATAATVSLTTAAVSLAMQLPEAARRLWWVYVIATVGSLAVIRATLVRGENGVPGIGGWGWACLPLFTGAWTSLVLGP
jgi:hypothetical protein